VTDSDIASFSGWDGPAHPTPVRSGAESLWGGDAGEGGDELFGFVVGFGGVKAMVVGFILVALGRFEI
jgi:hypothetical protein